MAQEDRKLTVAEVRKTISTSLATAFGFVIALLWSNLVLNGLATAGIPLQPLNKGDWGAWAVFAVTATVLTVVMIILIIVISRWGGTGIRGMRPKKNSD